MNRVLGIDQSMAGTAWVVLDDEKNVIAHGMIRTGGNTEPKYDYMFTSENKIDRFEYISNKLWEIRLKYVVSYISIEGLSFGSAGNATRDLAVLMGWIQSEIWEDGYWLETPATTLKKYATGNGRAEKGDMLEALPEPFQQGLRDTYKKSGKSSGLQDIPDAYWLACKGVDFFFGGVK